MIREMLGIAEGILQDLHNDHQEVASQLETIMDTEDAAHRTALFEKVRAELAAHLEAEEEVLYSRLERSDDEDARTFALEGANEHHLVEDQLRRMMQDPNTGGEAWTAQLTVLREMVEHHVDEEESTGFSCARSEFDKEELERLGQQFQAQKQAVLNRV